MESIGLASCHLFREVMVKADVGSRIHAAV